MTATAGLLAALSGISFLDTKVVKPYKLRNRSLDMDSIKPKRGEANSLTREQVERRRKQLRKANFAANVRYRRAVA